MTAAAAQAVPAAPAAPAAAAAAPVITKNAVNQVMTVTIFWGVVSSGSQALQMILVTLRGDVMT